jgi:U4/U6.U5 tri-snRNP-associated protein 1
MKLDLSLDLASNTSAEDWVKQSRLREIEQQKRAAVEKARRLQEDEEEQVQSLSASRSLLSSISNGNRSTFGRYTASDLKGLKVKHNANAFEAGSEVILTLADTDLLATDEYGRVKGLNEEEDDILENVNIAEHERKLQREKQLKRLKQPLYSGYDDAEFEAGKIGVKQDLLPQYEDEEMKRKRQRLEASFVLGDNGSADLSSFVNAVNQVAASNVPNRVATSLAMEAKQMNAFMTKDEIKFRKVKKSDKKRSGRSKKNDEEDDVIAQEVPSKSIAQSNSNNNGEDHYDLGQILGEGGDDDDAHAMAVDRDVLVPTLPTVALAKRPRLQAQAVVFEDEDAEFAAALARSRALANKTRSMEVDDDDDEEEENIRHDRGAKIALELSKEVATVVPKSSVIVDDEDVDVDGRRSDGKLVFNSTMEFAARLQAVMNDRARSKAEAALKGMERNSSAIDLNAGESSLPSRSQISSAPKRNNSDDMSIGDDKSANSQMDSAGYSWEDLTEDDDEAANEDLDAIEDEQLAFLHKQPLVSKGMAATLELLKSSGELNRSNELAGRAKDSRAIDPSREESGVKIEYRDEFGRKLTQKEAFRQLSYKFHGYGPSKKKLEKRLKVSQCLYWLIHMIDSYELLNSNNNCNLKPKRYAQVFWTVVLELSSH